MTLTIPSDAFLGSGEMAALIRAFERIGVTDKTLAKLEKGESGVRLETLAMALLVLGELHRLEEMLDPARDGTGLVLEQNRLPERIVNRRKVQSTSGISASSGSDQVDDEGSTF